MIGQVFISNNSVFIFLPRKGSPNCKLIANNLAFKKPSHGEYNNNIETTLNSYCEIPIVGGLNPT